MSQMKKCSKCKATVRMDYVWTDYFRACCPFQFLRNDTRICFNCLFKKFGKEFVIRIYYMLKNPVTCDDCKVTEGCPKEALVRYGKMNRTVKKEINMGKTAAHNRGRCDGRHGKSENPYHPEERDREDYRDGNQRGSKEKSESEAND